MENTLIEQIRNAKAEIEAAARAKAEADAEHRFVSYWTTAESLLDLFEKDLGTEWRQAAIVTNNNSFPVLKIRLGATLLFTSFTQSGARYWCIANTERQNKVKNFRMEGSHQRERLLLKIGQVAGLDGEPEEDVEVPF